MQQTENLLHSCYLRNACKVPAMAARSSALNGSLWSIFSAGFAVVSVRSSSIRFMIRSRIGSSSSCGGRCGQKLRLQAPLSVQFIDSPLLPWVGHTEADREFSGVFFSIHCVYQSVPPDIEADSPSHLRRCPQ